MEPLSLDNFIIGHWRRLGEGRKKRGLPASGRAGSPIGNGRRRALQAHSVIFNDGVVIVTLLNIPRYIRCVVNIRYNIYAIQGVSLVVNLQEFS